MERTLPKLRFPSSTISDPNELVVKRYGTHEMCEIWGAERTMEYQLQAQGQSALTLSEMNSDVVPLNHAIEIAEKATLEHISPDRIRHHEERTGHDIIAVSLSLEEQVSSAAATHVGKGKTSADTTQPARALQMKKSVEVVSDTVENLRDIVIEKSLQFIDIPHMDQSHEIDALPGVAGRPFAHYAELLQSGLERLSFSYNHSIMGKWSDATGNSHQLEALGMNGLEVEEKYCEALGISHMIAPAQVPGLEYEFDIFCDLARITETMNNLADYIQKGKGSDRGLFRDGNPKKRKGSSSMPQKDAVGGNPTSEEQVIALKNYMRGALVTAVSNCEMDYARHLGASASGRINFETTFKFFDHAARRLSSAVYWLEINEERAQERIDRSYEVTTSNRVMTYLTDHRRTTDPMVRSQAHDLMGKLATKAWKGKIHFADVLLEYEEVTSRLDEATIRELTDASTYIGNSKERIRMVAENYHGKDTIVSI